MPKISEARIAILATDGYERSELREPLAKLRERGAKVEVLSVKPGEIRSWDKGDWGDSVAVDRLVGEARPDDYDGLVVEGKIVLALRGQPSHLSLPPSRRERVLFEQKINRAAELGANGRRWVGRAWNWDASADRLAALLSA